MTQKKENEQQNLEGIKLKATKPRTLLEDGAHNGIIGNIKYRASLKNDEGYQYVDVYIDVKKEGEIITLKAGFPFFLSELSTFGKFLINSGFGFVEDKEYSLKEIYNHLVERNVSFQTSRTETPKGTFCNIIRETIKFN